MPKPSRLRPWLTPLTSLIPPLGCYVSRFAFVSWFAGGAPAAVLTKAEIASLGEATAKRSDGNRVVDYGEVQILRASVEDITPFSTGFALICQKSFRSHFGGTIA
jgi:hypothetical protein